MFHQEGLFKAIKYFGSQQALAKAINASQQQVNYWLNSGKNISYEYVLKIEAATNGTVSRYDLAPYNQETNAIVEQLVAQGVKKFISKIFDEAKFEFFNLENSENASRSNFSLSIFNYIETLAFNSCEYKLKPYKNHKNLKNLHNAKNVPKVIK